MAGCKKLFYRLQIHCPLHFIFFIFLCYDRILVMHYFLINLRARIINHILCQVKTLLIVLRKFWRMVGHLWPVEISFLMVFVVDGSWILLLFFLFFSLLVLHQWNIISGIFIVVCDAVLIWHRWMLRWKSPVSVNQKLIS